MLSPERPPASADGEAPPDPPARLAGPLARPRARRRGAARVASALLALCLGLAPVAAPAQAEGETRRIALAVAPGLEMRFEQSTASVLDMAMTVAGQAFPVTRTISEEIAGTLTVLAVEDGVPTRARLVLDADSATETTVMGLTQTEPHPLAGRTVELTRTAQGVAIVPDHGLDRETRGEIADYLDLGAGAHPDRPVAPGDRWRADPSLLGDTPGITPELTLVLERVEARAGREVAVARGALTLDGETEGVAMPGSGEGPVVFDLATGVLVEARLDAVMDMDGTTVSQGVPTQVSGSATVTALVTSTLVNAPTAPAGPAALSGRFSDGELTLAIEGDDVVIEFAGARYEGRVETREADALRGSFEADGTRFPFVAERRQDGVVLESGGREYRLSSTAPGDSSPGRR
ncbi:MAG: hypothetical protein ACFBWO_17475 [Paracoccaceae bacterium]